MQAKLMDRHELSNVISQMLKIYWKQVWWIFKFIKLEEIQNSKF